MSSLLHRLGRWCAAHAWRTIAIWLVLLATVGGLAATVGQPLTDKVSIPGTDFERVLGELGDTVPEAAGGVGTVVLESSSVAFTQAQRDAIDEAFAAWGAVPHVERVNDPFAAQEQLDGSAALLADGAQQIAAGQAQLDQGNGELAAAQGQLEAGEAVLDQLVAADPDDPAVAPLRAQLEQGRAQLEEGRAQAAQGAADLLDAREQLADGEAIAAATAGARLVSEDGRYAVVQLQFDEDAQSVPVEDRALIPATGDPILRDAGVEASYSVEITQDTSLVGPGEIIGLTVAVLVLVGVLGTLIAAGLPLLVALLGVGVGLGGAIALTAIVDLNSTTPALALMLGLAVGIDYALFIVNRHRTQLVQGAPMGESIARAVATAGSAVVFAGATVVIALAALVLSGIPILAQMGLVAAATVAVTVAVAITVCPAVLSLMGARVLSRRAWRAAGLAPTDGVGSAARPSARPDSRTRIRARRGGGPADGYARAITAKPWLTVIGVIALLGIVALPAASLQLGLPDGGSEPAGSSANTAYTTIGTEFGPGVNGPVIALATLPATPEPRTDAEVVGEQARIATALDEVGGVDSVLPFGVSEDRGTLAFQVVPTTGPADPRTKETLEAIQLRGDLLDRYSDTEIGLTGATVANVEISERLGAALPAYLAVVVGLSLVILMLVFRSIVVPVVATVGFLLSVAAAFGATVAVHQWGWLGGLFGVTQPGPLLSFMPIILIGVLFGLAMDYQMFLVSGMHEAHAHGEDARAAVRTGFVQGAKVVTAAALIMTSVFLGFAYSHLVMVRPIGFGLAVGVLVDAVLVRMTLTPAVMHLLGDRAWYLPRWLDRLLPDLDVEGVKLTERLDAERRGAERQDAASVPARA